MFGGNKVSYNALGDMELSNAPNELWKLRIAGADSAVAGESNTEGWTWQFIKPLQFGVYDASLNTRQVAWAVNNKILLENAECWIGPQTISPNECVASSNDCNSKPETCLPSSSGSMTSQEMKCNIKIKMQIPAPTDDVGRMIMLGDEPRPIAKWEIPFDEFKYWDLFKIWYHDWRMIDPDFGEGFLLRFRNIFHLQMVQNLKEDKYELPEALPRTPRYARTGSVSTATPVATGISIDECKYKCDLDYACPAFDYVDETGACIIGEGQYVRTSFLGATLKQSDKYRMNFDEGGIIEKVNRYVKRAIMMQGRYSVLNELGTNIVTDPWQGFDWMIHREMGPSFFTQVPAADGSRKISLMCSRGNCERTGAVAFQKATYTKKEANAICGIMDPEFSFAW
jgi:hypothetical protein